MDSLFLAKLVVALAPVQLLLLLFAALDVFHLLRLREILLLLLLGAVAALATVPVSWLFLHAGALQFSTYSHWVAPFVEEVMKCAVIVALFAANRIGFKVDAAISGFAVGAGFSFVENLLYLNLFGDHDFGEWLIRGLGTAVMHGGTAALFAIISHQLTEREIRAEVCEWRLEPLRFLPGLAAAILIHAGFNQLVRWPAVALAATLLLVPLTLILVFWYSSRECRHWLVDDIRKHRHVLAQLHREGLGALIGEARLEALSNTFRGRAPFPLIQEYVELHMILALRAEELFYDDLREKHPAPSDADRAKLLRLQELKRELGKTVVATLATLLPLTRMDMWEIAELAHMSASASTRARRHGSG